MKLMVDARIVLGYLYPVKPQTTDTHLYIPVRLLAAIKKLARENRRSTTAEIVIAVEEYIKARNGRKESRK